MKRIFLMITFIDFISPPGVSSSIMMHCAFCSFASSIDFSMYSVDAGLNNTINLYSDHNQ